MLNAVRKGSDKCYKNLAATWCTAAAKIWRQHGAPQLQKSGGNIMHRSCKNLTATWCTAAAKIWRQPGAPQLQKSGSNMVHRSCKSPWSYSINLVMYILLISILFFIYRNNELIYETNKNVWFAVDNQLIFLEISYEIYDKKTPYERQKIL